MVEKNNGLKRTKKEKKKKRKRKTKQNPTGGLVREKSDRVGDGGGQEKEIDGKEEGGRKK